MRQRISGQRGSGAACNHRKINVKCTNWSLNYRLAHLCVGWLAPGRPSISIKRKAKMETRRSKWKKKLNIKIASLPHLSVRLIVNWLVCAGTSLPLETGGDHHTSIHLLTWLPPLKFGERNGIVFYCGANLIWPTSPLLPLRTKRNNKQWPQ